LHRIGVRKRPTAVLEAVAAIFVRPARRLHNPVERETRERNDPAHLKLLSLDVYHRHRAGFPLSTYERLSVGSTPVSLSSN
jgi:hypothetical protein